MDNAQLVKLDRAGAHEALGAAHGAVGSVLTTPVFSQAELDEAGAETEEAPRKTFSSSSWTGHGAHEAPGAAHGAANSALTKPVFL